MMSDAPEALAGRPVPRMTPAEYDHERARLRSLYGDDAQQAATKRDQALALLFARSGWTQEELAKKESKTQQWVAYHLRFGRFLNYTTTVVNETTRNELTERRFRDHWENTSKTASERDRFSEIAEAMQQPRRARPTIAPAIVADFGDAQWHKLSDMAAKHGDGDEKFVAKTLENLSNQTNRKVHAKIERRKYGKSFQFRIFPEAAASVVTALEIRTKLDPYLKQLIEQGKQNMATMDPSTVKFCSFMIDQQIDEWNKRPPRTVGTRAERSKPSPRKGT